MSKYIDRITKENKTLTEKYTTIKAENDELLIQNSGLRNQVYELKQLVEALKERQCTSGMLCRSLDDGFKNMFGLFNTLMK
jgi:hypothetical protein